MQIEKRDTKVILLTFKNWVLKIPYTVGGMREVIVEIKNIKSINGFFKKYLPVYKTFYCFFAVERLEPFNGNIKPYFDELFRSDNQYSHGDFHRDNIFTKNGRIYFIDWSRYARLSRHFDLINYYIVAQDEPWFEVWKNEYSKNNKTIFGIKILNSYWLDYANCKANEDKRMFKVRCINKDKKYNKIIEALEILK